MLDIVTILILATGLFLFFTGTWYWIGKLRDRLIGDGHSLSQLLRWTIRVTGLFLGVLLSAHVLNLFVAPDYPEVNLGLMGPEQAILEGKKFDKDYAFSLWERASTPYDTALVQIALESYPAAESLLIGVTQSEVSDSGLIARAYSMKALLNRFQDKDTAALEDYRMALKYDSTSVTALAGLVISLARTGEPEMAKIELRNLLRQPADITKWYFQGLAYWELGNPDLALYSLGKALELNADYHAAELLKARIMSENGRPN